jgi:hypothetical protein
MALARHTACFSLVSHHEHSIVSSLDSRIGPGSDKCSIRQRTKPVVRGSEAQADKRISVLVSEREADEIARVVFRRVEISKVGAVGPGCSGTKVALLADDRRVAPLRFVEACLVDLSSVRLVCVVNPRC